MYVDDRRGAWLDKEPSEWLGRELKEFISNGLMLVNWPLLRNSH